MANPNAGSKFASVNLNKSYGHPAANASRTRPVTHGGGMVVLSRPRSSTSAAAKTGSRLSVPPPLNLPSLRKEHEKYDQFSSLGGSSGARNAGSGSGHASGTFGWTRQVNSAVLLKKEGKLSADGSRAESPGECRDRANGIAHMPAAAGSGSVVHHLDNGLTRDVVPVEKAVLLRGEDFPALHAAIPAKKQEGDLDNKKSTTREIVNGQSNTLHMRPQMGSSSYTAGNVSNKNEVSGNSRTIIDAKEEKLGRYLSEPLPTVCLHHTSEWEDDERDTGHGIPMLNGNRGLKRIETSKVKESNFPRSDFDAELSKVSTRGTLRGEGRGRDVAIPTRDAYNVVSWRASPSLLEGDLSARYSGAERNGMGARHFTPTRELCKENKYNESLYKENSLKGDRAMTNGPHDLRKDSDFDHPRKNGYHVSELSVSRVVEKRPHGHCSGSLDQSRGDAFQRSSTAKVPSPYGNNNPSLSDPLLSFSRERHLFSNGGKPYREDAFDMNDPFSGHQGGGAKLFGRKKDALRQVDLHDPERESFEAELERVQKLQEQERHRVAAEQARVLELAQREEEERQRLAKEEEEKRRRLEEEARESARRAEQQRIEAVKRAEKQKLAREEEKRQILLEEERRKEAAKRKLLELEARIARRQADAIRNDKSGSTTGDEKMPGIWKGRDLAAWEDGDGMFGRITSSSSSDSSSLNRSAETGSRPHSSREGHSFFSGGGKHSNLWSRDSIENRSSSPFILQQDHDSAYFSNQDGVDAGGSYSVKDFSGGYGVLSHHTSTKGLMPHMLHDDAHPRGNMLISGGDDDHRSRNTEFDEVNSNNSMDKFGDSWGRDHLLGNLSARFADRLYQNPDAESFSSFGKSRHSMRQPRVLPPPPSLNKSIFKADSECYPSSRILNEDSKYTNISRGDHILPDSCEINYQDAIEGQGRVTLEVVNNVHNEQKDDKSPSRCNSQSSLSVTSPPDSPPHLSHDELDDSGEITVPSVANDNEHLEFSKSENVSSLEGAAEDMNLSVVPTVEDERWAGDNEELQGQEEYDEGSTFSEEEVYDDDGENLNVAQSFQDMHLKELRTADKIGQVVPGHHKRAHTETTSDKESEISTATPYSDVKAMQIPAVSAVDAHVGVVGGEYGFQSERKMVSSSETMDETETALDDLSVQGRAPSPNFILKNAEATISSGMLDENAVVSARNHSLFSEEVPSVLPVASSIPAQGEISTAKLQGDIYSAVSLIQSPLPAIQIGSIQMPLLQPLVGSSITHSHQLQCPLFQFGQLTYPPQMSQGILPLSHKTLTIVQPSVSSNYSGNEDSLLNCTSVGSPQNSRLNTAVPLVHIGNESGVVPETLNLSVENTVKDQSASLISGDAKENVLVSQSHTRSCVEERIEPQPVSQEKDQAHNFEKNSISMNVSRESQVKQQMESVDLFSLKRLSNERDFGGGSEARYSMAASKGKRFLYAIKADSRSSLTPYEAPRVDSFVVQRRPRRNFHLTGFRMHEKAERKPLDDVQSNHATGDEKSKPYMKVDGFYSKAGNKRDIRLNKTKPLVEPETPAALSSHIPVTERKMNKGAGNNLSSVKLISTSEMSCPRRECLSKAVVEDVDAPLQNGVVRVFKQPGIEAPSDEDDFIEVRSKRQILNDRREQRENEIKAKSRAMKAPRKPRMQSKNIPAISNKPSSEEKVTGLQCKSVVHDGWASASDEVSTGFASGRTSPPLPPIGTPAVGKDANPERRMSSVKTVNTNSAAVVSSGGTSYLPDLPFENENNVIDKVITPFGSWPSLCINQKVLAFPKPQVVESIEHAQLEGKVGSHECGEVAPIGDHTSSNTDIGKKSTVVLSHEKPFSSSTSPLSSLLAGEKIQFGAVTSPTILPTSSLPASGSIGPPGSHRSDVMMEHNLSTSQSESMKKVDRNKQPDATCVHLEDTEAEAEAAASAVAVAAISSDELLVNELDASVSVSDDRSIGSAELQLPSGCGVSVDKKLPSQSKAEEPLAVALPADLSLETPSLSLWPPLPSLQNSSGTILPHFNTPPPPSCSLNSMLGGPIFAYGSRDESSSSQPQSPSSTSATGSLGTWQPCHSAVNSFYGTPNGFSGPFIGPGGIPGIQGPHHMVLYNHFAPIGQFRQAGLSFMGTAYIAPGKQPEWKHTTSAVGISEAEIPNLNNSSGQCNPCSVPASIQNLPSGSTMLPIASHVAMFDLSPFQASADGSVQNHWSSIPTSAIHSVPSPVPPLLQQQAKGNPLVSQSSGFPVETLNARSLQEPWVEASAGVCASLFPVNCANPHFPGKGLTGPSATMSACAQTSKSTPEASANRNVEAKGPIKSTSNDGQGLIAGSSSSESTSSVVSPGNQPHNQSTPYKLHPIGHSQHRGTGSSRRGDFQSRYQNSGPDKNHAPSKMKQVYVPKGALPTTSAA